MLRMSSQVFLLALLSALIGSRPATSQSPAQGPAQGSAQGQAQDSAQDGAKAGSKASAKNVDASPEPVRVVVLGDLSRSEAAMLRGLRAGFADVHRAQKDYEWMRPYKLITLDDRGDPALAKKLLEKQIKIGRVDALLGAGRCIGDSKLRAVIASSGLTCFAPSSPAVGKAPATGVFEMRSPRKALVAGLVDRLIEDGCKRFAVCVDKGDAAARGLVQSLLEKRELSLMAHARLERGKRDVSDAVTAVANALPDAILFLGEARSSLAFARRFREKFPKAKVQFATLDHMEESAIVRSLEDASEGLYVASALPWPWEEWLPVTADWLACAKRNKFAPDVQRSFGAYHGYVAARLFARLITDEIGGNDVARSLGRALASRETWDLEGIRMSWKRRARSGHRKVYLSQIVGRELQALPEGASSAPGK